MATFFLWRPSLVRGVLEDFDCRWRTLKAAPSRKLGVKVWELSGCYQALWAFPLLSRRHRSCTSPTAHNDPPAIREAYEWDMPFWKSWSSRRRPTQLKRLPFPSQTQIGWCQCESNLPIGKQHSLLNNICDTLLPTADIYSDERNMLDPSEMKGEIDLA